MFTSKYICKYNDEVLLSIHSYCVQNDPVYMFLMSAWNKSPDSKRCSPFELLF